VVDGEPDEARHAALLGERLRHVRQQQNLSLHDVEARSKGELKASVVGAYERGERTISIIRLHRMAAFFRVPVSELLPEVARPDAAPEPTRGATSDRIVIDLVALEERSADEPVLVRYVDAITARRGDFNGRVLTVRAADLDTLAAVMDTRPDALRARLLADGLVRRPR
jgi:transcriptional regulator with XRE-family HTH domain